jgi:putative acetyltransferase
VTVADVTLRAERPEDVDAIRDVVARSFGEAVVAELVAALRASPDWLHLAFVAERDGEVIGYGAFTRSLLDAPRRLVPVLVLSPVCVAPEHQGVGVGSALVRYGLAQVADSGEPLVFLEGDPAYYARFGFGPGGPAGFRRPSLRIPEPAFQVLKQRAFEPWMTGTLVYSRVFWDLDCVGLRDG